MIGARITPAEARVFAHMVQQNRASVGGRDKEMFEDLRSRGLVEIRSTQEGVHAYPTAGGVSAFAIFQHFCCERCGNEKPHPTERFCGAACKAADLDERVRGAA